jgi:hypothetical protein
MFDNAKNIYIIEEVQGGGLKKYIDDFKQKHTNAFNIQSLKNIMFEKNDILFIHNLYFTEIEIKDILELEVKIILCLHDFYWMHEFVMRKFYNDEYPPVHTNYLRENICIDVNIIKLFKKAKHIICPSIFVFEHYKKYFNTDNFIYTPHDDIDIHFSNHLNIKIKNNIINVGVLHSLTKCKGLELIDFLKQNITNYKNYDIRYLIVNKNIDKYDENEDIKNIIIKHSIHLTTFLNIWGETYSYCLSKVLNVGIPILYNNIGSFKERIPNNEKYFKVFEDEKDVYDYEILKNKFYEILDYIIIKQNV